MDWQRRCIQVCAGAILLAAAIRLLPEQVPEFVMGEDAASFLVYLQTGRVVRLPPEPETTEPTEAAQPTETLPDPSVPVFLEEFLALVPVKYTTSYRPDLEALLERPLDFNLGGEGPQVLILHTHGTESYTPSPGYEYEASASYRTLDERCNMLAIGDAVAQVLEDAGVEVIHDRALHDYPSYNNAYPNAAAATAAYLKEYPSIRLVLDLHRDAADTATGQLVTECSVEGTPSAQLMLVMGTGSGGLSHPDWEKNLSLALKLQVVLEQENPGICRDLSLRYSRYNQHLSTGALLVEVGATGNTMDEALSAARALARGILTLFAIA